jgi:hypothetical protein
MPESQAHPNPSRVGQTPPEAQPQLSRDHLLAEYRRNARRCRNRGDLQRVHAGLRELNRRMDQTTRHLKTPVTNATVDSYEHFAILAAQAMEAGTLRYSVRQRLARQAKALGIGSFEASLLIAAVQHAARNYPDGSSEAPAGHSTRWIWLTILAVELAIALAVWRLCRV